MSEIVLPHSYRAPAKINLTLEIVGMRPDGYHELVSVMQTVTLWDTLTVTSAATFKFSCSDPSLAAENLVERAAIALAQCAGVLPSAHIQLEKRVPSGAGLGGGSSDAATALIALSRLWDIPLTHLQLGIIAASLGSDIPFFLTGGTCLVEGRGEVVRRLGETKPVWYLLVNPGIQVSTARVFAALPPTEWSNGEESRSYVLEIEDGRVPRAGPNGLERAMLRAYPEAQAPFSAIRREAPHARLSGSGATMFAEFMSRDDAVQTEKAIRRLGYWTYIARPYSPMPQGTTLIDL